MTTELFVGCRGGVSNHCNTIMKVTSTHELPHRLREMMKDVSVVDCCLEVNDMCIRVTNIDGYESYFETEHLAFAKSINGIMYLSNIPEPGMRWNGGYIFIKTFEEKKFFGFTYNKCVWYIISPLKYTTVP